MPECDLLFESCFGGSCLYPQCFGISQAVGYLLLVRGTSWALSVWKLLS